MRIAITEQHKQNCQQFARQYVNTVRDHYAKDRKQSNPKIMEGQACWAKLAEVAVEIAIQQIGIEIIDGVDFSIQQRHQKSFDADIKTVNARCHVKSVHWNRPEKSWAFQKSDPVVYEPRPDEVLVFCVTYPDHVEIIGACKAVDALEFYAPPRKSELSGNKEFLYLENRSSKFKVPEIKTIICSLEEILQSMPECRVKHSDRSRQFTQTFAWKEF